MDSEAISPKSAVDKLYNWPPLTACVLPDATAPAATLVSRTGAVAPTPPRVTLLCDALSYITALPSPLDSAVDSDATLLLVVLSPVDSDITLLFVVLKPVLSDATLLFVVLSPVDNEVTPLCAVLIPVEADVDNEANWLPLTASVLVALTAPAATFVSVTGALAPTPPNVTFVCVLSSYCTAFPSPVESAVDSEVTLLFVVLKPVESEVTPLSAVLIPVEAEVDSEDTALFVALSPVLSDATLLFVVLNPVDSEITPLCAVLIPVDADVDSEAS